MWITFLKNPGLSTFQKKLSTHFQIFVSFLTGFVYVKICKIGVKLSCNTASMTAFVCLDFPKFIVVKMRSTLKPYFAGGCDEDLRRRYLPYFKQRFALADKKDGFKA